MEEEAKPVRQPQRRLNPHMQEVARAEVLKLLQAGIIYLISDSLWVSPTQVVPKKSGITVVQNDKGEDVSTCLTTGWRHPFYCFLDGYSGYFQIEIDLEDQEKTTFTCPFDLVLNWEKCHFMVQQGIVLGHIISKEGIEVDKAKVELIVKLSSPTNVKGDAKFIWDERCQRSFEQLKSFLTTTPIVRAPNWKLPFEVMCDDSDFAIGAVLGQREDGKPYVIYYAMVFTDHSALKYLLTKQDAKARLIRWILLLQEFNLQIKDKKWSRKCGSRPPFKACNWHIIPMYAHIANYLVTGEVPIEWKAQDMKHFFAKIHAYYWEELFLFKYCADQIIRKCVPEQEQQGILSHCMRMLVEATLLLRRQL
ncbi:hypothetical protein CK203_088499 [Vitis vinifera]|uniref:Reverse transcriptase/retrotransposon-derived protein RNase H-like domain-containing protein n=1 Tax=Vitis vinifera TaxID=29760 RepID=A0A438EZW8_VITVI|nr:hypothetical protein CK203_088499 [Vitis vinifera]